MSNRKNLPQDGFSAVEGVLLVIIIAVVAGAVLFVHNKNQKTATNDAITTAAVATTAAKASGIDQQNIQEAQDEAAINSTHESSEQTDAISANASATDMGGAYNESNF